jgi:hypothetical protein
MLKGRYGLVHLLVITLIGVALFGCEKEEKAPAPETQEKVSGGYDALLPEGDVPEGWKQSGEAKVFVGDKLYDSINGAADRFFQYSFRQQYVARYASDDPEKTVNVEVYDMGTPTDAFGIFSTHDNVMSEHVGIGLGATISEMNLDFCQGQYFVRLLAIGFEEGEAERPLRAFAEAIVENVEVSDGLPELVELLPEGYKEGSRLFFHTWDTLNERRYVAEENVLNLDKKTNGVLATYTTEDKETFVLENDILYVIEYRDQKASQDAAMKYIKFLDKQVRESREEGKPADELLQLIVVTEPTMIGQLYKGEGQNRRLFTNMRVLGRHLFGVWEITDAEKAKGLANTLARTLPR